MTALDLTSGQHFNISFPKAVGLSIQKLHSKSIYLSVLLNFPNRVPGQLTIMSNWNLYIGGKETKDNTADQQPSARV